jgi:hypothetical protein
MPNEEESGRRNGQMMDDIVRDADEYYGYLSGKHVTETRLDAAVVSLVVWFAAFAVLGIGAITTIRGPTVYEYLAAAMLVAITLAAASGLVTYTVRRRRGFKFVELGSLLKKMKEGGASSEDGLRLMDAMHQAALVARKRKLDSAFEYGVVAFAIVAVIGENAGIGALAGVVTYLYFRFEALRGYEREERRYDESKKELLQSL